MPKTVIVVPCYNEEKRLDPAAFLPLLARDGLELLFVNDGSTDDTDGRLRELTAQGGGRIRVLSLPVNGGKAEAVRRGMREAIAEGATIVGYMDADASTPASEMLRLLGAMDARSADVVMGARVQLLGSDIRRHRARHYLGRIFATTVSLMLALPVYDTQCGAKLFRVGPALRAALEAPFASRWIFDVELLSRLLTGTASVPRVPRAKFLEVPLETWSDVAGSKLSPYAMVRSGLEVAAIGIGLMRKRKTRGQRAPSQPGEAAGGEPAADAEPPQQCPSSQL